MLLDDKIRKIDPESFEYSDTDIEKRAEYFYQMYQNCGGLIDIPYPLQQYEEEGAEIADDEYWLQSAAYHAHIALMDALAGLFEVLTKKVDKQNGENT